MAWFKDWFNSPYYHILYGKRNDTEANLFIRNIAEKLQFKPDELALDLACGKGRHSIELAKYRLIVDGVDLSGESIRYAEKAESPRLTFHVHDMRKVYKQGYFDYVFNLFTSFGYFANSEDNLLTLDAVRQNLKKDGIFVQDYFNSTCVIQQLVPFEQKMIKDIQFTIEKKISGQKIFKSIRFSDKGNDFHFTEEVSLFSLNDFEKMYARAGLKIKAIYGDYSLSEFDPAKSSRIILISNPV